jgi:hypothetical protein
MAAAEVGKYLLLKGSLLIRAGMPQDNHTVGDSDYCRTEVAQAQGYSLAKFHLIEHQQQLVGILVHRDGPAQQARARAALRTCRTRPRQVRLCHIHSHQLGEGGEGKIRLLLGRRSLQVGNSPLEAG